ncbi:unnamed protein product, partial [Prorocentrum cordatum]
MFSAFDEIWIECGGPGARPAHRRIAVALSPQGHEHYAMLASDFDVYVEEWGAGNANLRKWWEEWGRAAAPQDAAMPPGLRRRDFAALPLVAQLAQAFALGAAKMAARLWEAASPRACPRQSVAPLQPQPPPLQQPLAARQAPEPLVAGSLGLLPWMPLSAPPVET